MNNAAGCDKVLVVGGAGYIGSMLSRQLLARGYQVRVLDALLYGDHALRGLTCEPGFELIEGDSRDLSTVVRAVHGVDAMVHLGEIVGDPACALDEHVTLEINVAATRLLAEVAQGFGVRRFIYTSSCSTYGASDGIVDETSDVNPVSLYGRAKVAAEHILLTMHSQRFHPVIVRLATVFGASPRPRFDLVVNTLAAQAAVDGRITIFGGAQWRPFVHVADVARALTVCLEKPAALVEGQIFNVGSDSQNYTIAQIGNLIRSILPQTDVHTVANAEDHRDYHVSFKRIQQELGFQATVDVAAGVREIIAAIRGGVIPAYGDPRHNNALYLRSEHASHRVQARYLSPLYQPDRALLRHMLVEETRHVSKRDRQVAA